MTDKELLTFAAKAAEINFKMQYQNYVDAGFPAGWNPLEDDGDALRLAGKLHISLLFEQEFYGWDVEANACGERCEPDPCAATRRAIVRAAAEIGKEMQ